MIRDAPRPEVLILGLGNPSMGDDGFGAAVVESLRAGGLPVGCAAEPTADVLSLPAIWNGQRRVWLVDAVAAGARPGTVHRFDHAELLSLSVRAGSCHHLDLASCLQWILASTPGLADVRFRLWGCEPQRLAPEAPLSPTVTRAVAVVVSELLAETSRVLPGVHPGGRVRDRW